MSRDLAFDARINIDYKRVVQTADTIQATVMCMFPKTDIGSEIHAGYDQVVCVVEGNGIVTVNGMITPVGPGSVVLIPGGAQHNVHNTHPEDKLRIVMMYAPPKFPPGTVIKQSVM